MKGTVAPAFGGWIQRSGGPARAAATRAVGHHRRVWRSGACKTYTPPQSEAASNEWALTRGNHPSNSPATIFSARGGRARRESIDTAGKAIPAPNYDDRNGGSNSLVHV